MRRPELISIKQLTHELGVSRTTLWRALHSGIRDFPSPTFLGRRIYWRAGDVERLEVSLLQFRGRCVFERDRKCKRLEALKRARLVASKNKERKVCVEARRGGAAPVQGELF